VKRPSGSRIRNGSVSRHSSLSRGSLALSSHVREEEQLFRDFFDNAPIGKAITAPDGSWVRVNSALATMLGYSLEELQATSFLLLTHPDDLAETHEAVRALLAGERDTCSFEKRFRAKDGSMVWVHVTSRLRRDADGRPLHLLTYVMDITDRRRADRDLRESETRYRRLFESAKDGILILAADTGCIVDVNPFMTELTGCPRGEFLGKHLWEIGPFKDTAASKDSFAELQAKDYVRYDDLPLKTHDGRRVEVEFVSNVYLVNDEKVIQCNIRDVTVRKGAERALRLRDRAIQAVSQGIIITDPCKPDNPIIYTSPGFARLTGYESEEMIGKNCRCLQGPNTDPAALATLRDAIRQGRACTVELLNYRKDGTRFWNHLTVSPVSDDAGQITNFIGVQTDVTERRQLESQFRQGQKMEAVGRLAGGVAHDFNNALSVILSYSDLIGDDLKADEPVRVDIEEIRKAALRAAGLTRQLLAFSRQQVLDARVLNLHESVAGVEKMLHRLLGADIELTVLSTSDMCSIKADPGQVEQVLVNLAVNARDAMPRGGELTIDTENVELGNDYARAHPDVKPGSYVMLAVTDNGIGMDEETQARIFEPFFTTKEEGKGTGLGLATVFGIVKQSGGHIGVLSERSKGTTFKLYFPQVSGVAEVRPSEPPPTEFSRGSETILLVEDDDQVRALAQNILRRCGYVVLAASNGGEALLIFEKHGPSIQLLLTDVVLPRMSGWQLAERLASMRQGMKVLFMSGYTNDARLQHGALDPGVAYLQKPLTPASLTRRVREVLGGGSAHNWGKMDRSSA
jgi:two-component system cell cycle sensor histidine kinase/response regulator CckA